MVAIFCSFGGFIFSRFIRNSHNQEGSRRVIVTTNIAETSLTIPGVRHVIDTGRVKQKKYHPATGMQLLKVCWCSKAQSWQRAGRAGRESTGNVYRLYTESQFGKMDNSTIPEIQRSPLANVCLQVPVLIRFLVWPHFWCLLFPSGRPTWRDKRQNPQASLSG